MKSIDDIIINRNIISMKWTSEWSDQPTVCHRRWVHGARARNKVAVHDTEEVRDVRTADRISHGKSEHVEAPWTVRLHAKGVVRRRQGNSKIIVGFGPKFETNTVFNKHLRQIPYSTNIWDKSRSRTVRDHVFGIEFSVTGISGHSGCKFLGFPGLGRDGIKNFGISEQNRCRNFRDFRDRRTGWISTGIPITNTGEREQTCAHICGRTAAAVHAVLEYVHGNIAAAGWPSRTWGTHTDSKPRPRKQFEAFGVVGVELVSTADRCWIGRKIEIENFKNFWKLRKTVCHRRN